ncbi:glycosyltransferase family 4 protein [Psychrobacter piscatorii]|uniref:Glycosyl transferase n=1 Tax=Psychrobacter piscatorii TaxID=554343 RepID=A0A0T6DSM3_9GAMM|nr:glycosyltransferase [Psychrobacter piscatorii]KRU22853.1 glycosyl transferase [Psychrobacter piscatorii]
MTKKVVHVIIGLNIGGAELMLKRLVLNSHRKGLFQHEVISLMDMGPIGRDLEEQGITVHALNMSSIISSPIVSLRLYRLLKKINPDVVQTWMYHSDLIGGLAAKKLGIKNIVWGIRTTDVSQGSSKLTVYLSRVCAKLSYYIPDKVICAAHVSNDYHISIGYDKTKMLVIPNGFEINKMLASQQDGLYIRNNNNLSSNDIVIGSVGRFNSVKNQKLFVEVASILVKKLPNLKFMIVGRGNDIENKELVSWIKNYNLECKFRLLGQRDDVPKCLKAMDVFCLHSKTEGFPNVLVEAMAAGLPCVSTNVGDAKHILQSYGAIVPTNDANALANSLISSINNIQGKSANDVKVLLENYIKDNYSMTRIEKLYSDVWSS